jgi:hypothetical protein
VEQPVQKLLSGSSAPGLETRSLLGVTSILQGERAVSFLEFQTARFLLMDGFREQSSQQESRCHSKEIAIEKFTSFIWMKGQEGFQRLC